MLVSQEGKCTAAILYRESGPRMSINHDSIFIFFNETPLFLAACVQAADQKRQRVHNEKKQNGLFHQQFQLQFILYKTS